MGVWEYESLGVIIRFPYSHTFILPYLLFVPQYFQHALRSLFLGV
jgi:hypothetical protein